MIPLKLKLHNFMCYRDVEPLDFSGIHLACVAGDNGHGKSALFDAITWGLWGKARASRIDDLIHSGQTEMEVEFDFALGENRYRVIRKRSSRGRGQSSLDLQMWDGERYRSFTEHTMHQTQARINELLRMDYDTFINSALLLQGRADEFTTKTPGERKRILGDILGLSLYEEYEEEAKQKAKAKEGKADQIAAQMEEMERELAFRPQYEEELEQARAEVKELSEKLRAAEEELRRLGEERRELDLKRQRIEELSDQLVQGERELADIQEQISTHQERLRDYEAVLAQSEDIEEGFAALTSARRLKEELDEKLSRLMELREQEGQLEKFISEAKHELALEQSLYAEKIRELEGRAQEMEQLGLEFAQAKEELKRLAQLEEEAEEKRRRREELIEQVAGLEANNEQMGKEISALQEKIKLLKKADAHCPLCGSPLSEERRNQLVEQLGAEGVKLEDRRGQNSNRITELVAQSKILQEEMEAIEGQLAAKSAAQKREATLEGNLDEARLAKEELEQRDERKARLDERLARRDYAVAEQEELAHISAQIEKLGYDGQAHEQVRKDVTLLSKFEEHKRKLDSARERIGEERESLKRLRESEARRQEALAAIIEKKEVLSREVARLAEVTARWEEMGHQVGELQEREAHARMVLGAARQKLDHCRHLAEEKKKKATREQELRQEQSIYDELRKAFGKNGLQAMIIESAIPEIEDEANRLLARMTDGRMHVRLETQRETLEGKPVETLQIKISDELGTRDYEMFSGGEAFRVNFAIRIALSKLLARRAGARLQTLVMDEGFGTQDTQGRERLVEAINSIKDDFERVLVITHIEELKDAFPVRIEVFKTPLGSQFTIL